jgi:hypothetical protein
VKEPREPSQPQTAQSATPSTKRPEQDPNLRALERTLVQQGGLVLPPGGYEIEPGLIYSHNQSQDIIARGGVLFVGAAAQRTEALDAQVIFRAGLPWNLQADLLVPYGYRYQRTEIGTSNDARRGFGLGDVEVGLSKQWIPERVSTPALLTAVNWKTTTGHVEEDPNFALVSRGTGFNAVQASIVAVKTQDPLAFLGTLSYTFNLPAEQRGNQVDPGDAIGFRLGVVFAASPEASLRVSYEHTFFRETRLNGIGVPGSDLAGGLVEIGADIVLTPTVLLNVGLGFGVSQNSPDVRLRVSLPIRLK